MFKSLRFVSKTLLFLALGAHFGPEITWAADIVTPRSAGIGGAGHGGPMINDAIFLNPAFISFIPAYGFSGSYHTFKAPESTGTGGNPTGRAYSVSVLDGRSEMFQAGAAYSIREDGTFVHVGASKSVAERLSLGTGAKFYFTQDGTRSSGRDFNFSVAYVPLEWFQAAIIVDNIFQADRGKGRGLYREIVVGTKFNWSKKLLVYLDPHYIPDLEPKRRLGYEAGVELVTFSDLYLRAGTFRNASVPAQYGHGRGWSAGLGWVAPRMSLDYAYQSVGEPAKTNAHIFGTTVFF